MSETQQDEQPPASVDLGTAIEQMVEDGMPPDGFHMMFFSEDFQLTEDCPTNLLLKMLGEQHNFADTIKRQVFQMPKGKIVTYEFAWLGEVTKLQQTLETIDRIIQDRFNAMVENNELRRHPQGRVSFLAQPPAHDCCASGDCEHTRGEEE
tara:strand:- start:3360 stop:3812 length:453 start_codon:yes stop_codon:yes gene_type:complete